MTRENIAVRDGKRIKRSPKPKETKLMARRSIDSSIHVSEEVSEEIYLEIDTRNFDIDLFSKAVKIEMNSGKTKEEAIIAALDNLESDLNYYDEKIIVL